MSSHLSFIFLRSVITDLTRNPLTLALTAAALTFSACSQDDDPAVTNGDRLTLSAQMGNPLTRATYDENKFALNDRISVAIQKIGTEGSGSDNTFIFKADGGTPTTTFTPEQSIYWQDYPNGINATAWYPAGAYSFPDNQSDAGKLAKADYLFASKSGITKANFNDTDKKFTFTHKTAMVKATLIKGTVATIDNAEVTFYGYTSGTPNTTDGGVSGTSSPNGEIIPWNNNDVHTALLIPHTYTSENFLRVNVSGKDYYWQPSSQELAAGNSYVLTITVNEKELSVAVTNSATWSAGSTHEVKAFLATIKGIPVKYIHAGQFKMGESLNYHVKLTKDFYLSKYLITFDQYDAFCEATNRNKPGDNSWGRGNRPVINVSWNDAKAFADWVGGSLPTEAQWEYACRAGTEKVYSYGNDANDSYMWYKTNSGGKTHPVGEKNPNPWGLYDMHGNVWEWCADWYGNYPGTTELNPKEDPTGAGTGSERVMRGGAWNEEFSYCRSASRIKVPPSNFSIVYGFRVVFLP